MRKKQLGMESLEGREMMSCSRGQGPRETSSEPPVIAEPQWQAITPDGVIINPSDYGTGPSGPSGFELRMPGLRAHHRGWHRWQ
jgi:hypothetical protein